MPRAVEDEKTKWAADVLQIHPDIRNGQLGVLRHFRSKLHLSVGSGVLVGGEWPQVSTLFDR